MFSVTYHIETIRPKLKRTIKPKKNQPFTLTEQLKNSEAKSRKQVSHDQPTRRQQVSHDQPTRKQIRIKTNMKKIYDPEIKLAKRDFVNQQLTKAPNQSKETPGNS